LSSLIVLITFVLTA